MLSSVQGTSQQALVRGQLLEKVCMCVCVYVCGGTPSF